MGRCKLGGLCNFAHGDDELRLQREGGAATARPTFGSGAEKLAALDADFEAFAAAQRALLSRLRQIAGAFEAPNTEGVEGGAASIEETLAAMQQCAAKYAETLSAVTGAPSALREVGAAKIEEAKLQKQIKYLISRLDELHSNEEKILSVLEKAKALVEHNVAEAALQLESVVYDSAADKATAELHKNLIEEARRKCD